MRKQVVGPQSQAKESSTAIDWLDVDRLVRVELTSEDSAYPIENALIAGKSPGGWRASQLGVQAVRFYFDKPQRVHHIRLRFVESNVERAQEFSLRYSSISRAAQEIVRQQWTFSPEGSTEELEDYLVQLDGVTMLELTIDPDRGRDRFHATLAELRIA